MRSGGAFGALLWAKTIVFCLLALAVPVVLLHSEGVSIPVAVLVSLLAVLLYAGLIYWRVRARRAQRDAG